MKVANPSPRVWIITLALAALAGWMLTAQPLAAQEAADTAEVATEVENDGEQAAEGAAGDGDQPAVRQRTIIDMFRAGGWAMYPLLLLSISGLGLIVYNFLAVRENKFLRPDVMEQTSHALSELHIDKAVELCDQTPAASTNILAAGLKRADVHDWEPEMVKEAVEEASAEELSGAYVFINYLSVIGSLSPMLGLLGTVSGMVKAFNAIAAEGVGNPQLLADNISEALITTATGMIIGIPAMFFFFFFKNKYGKITSGIGRVVGDQIFLLNKTIKLAYANWHHEQAAAQHDQHGHGHGEPGHH